MASLSPAQAALLVRIFRTTSGAHPFGYIHVDRGFPRHATRTTIRALWSRGLIDSPTPGAVPRFDLIEEAGFVLRATPDGMRWRCPDRSDGGLHVFSRDEEYDPGNPDNQPTNCERCGIGAHEMPERQRGDT